MKFLALSSSLLWVSVANAFSTNDVVYKSIKSAMPLCMSTSSEVASPFLQGPRIVRDELPVVYVYDHCPFCVRVRLALGVKNIKHNIHFMGNDDIPTPTKLVGKKIAPIFVSRSMRTYKNLTSINFYNLILDIRTDSFLEY